MTKLFYTLLLVLLIHPTFAQETKLDIQFNHEWSLKKFLVKQVRGPEARSLSYSLPYVHSATIKLTLNLDGQVIDLGFIEKAENDVFNKLFEKLARTTSGKWRFNEISEDVDKVYVILPFLHRTPPDLDSDFPKDLDAQFTAYHKSLSFEKLEGCDESNCIIWEEIKNVTGPRVR